MKKRNFTRHETGIRVKAQFAIWAKNSGRMPWKTSYALASALDLTPSSHFRSILAEMVADGSLIKREAPKSGRWKRFEYTLPEDAYTLPRVRQVAIKARGKVQGQLELW